MKLKTRGKMLASQLNGGKKQKPKSHFLKLFTHEGIKELRMLILEKKIIGSLGVWGQGNLSSF